MRTVFSAVLTLRGPILTRSSSPDASGVDAPFHTNKDESKLILPGTLVKGSLLDALRALADLDDGFNNLIPLLGTGSDDLRGSYAPHRARVQISDFTAPNPGNKTEAVTKSKDTKRNGRGLRYRIAIDHARGAVDPMAYQVIETPFAPGEEVPFSGSISIDATDADSAEETATSIERALRYCTSMGAHKTSGFGRIVGVKLGERLSITHGATNIDSDDLTLCLTILDPFCVSQSQPATNLFRSGDVIPGNVIKGAIATMVGEKAAGFLNNVSIGHAFPTVKGKRAVVAPLSLVSDENGPPRDVALDENARLGGAGKAPAFAIDWKDEFSGKVKERFDWPSLPRDLRVRTAIARGTGAAAEGKLFAIESILPPEGVTWVARVHCPEGLRESLRTAVGSQITSMTKTKARADVKWAAREVLVPAPWKEGRYYSVTLQTDALLFPSEDLDETTDSTKLLGLYQEAWAHLSGTSMELKRFFARQKMAGGKYVNGWFGQKTKRSYHPFILTEAGSVFVLEVKDAEAARLRVKGWLTTNLPLPERVETAYLPAGVEHFEALPYLPENGFGEVAINLAVPPQPEASR